MVVPLIGAIDSSRAQRIMESLLTGIAERGVSVAMIDITEVPVVDTQIANILIQATQAVRLLGAQVILTGIWPEIAQLILVRLLCVVHCKPASPMRYNLITNAEVVCLYFDCP